MFVRHGNNQQRYDERHKTHGVQIEAPGRAERAERQTREHGTHRPRQVELRRIQRHRVHQVFPLDQVRVKRLVSGVIERGGEPSQQANKQDFIHADDFEGSEHGEDERQQHHVGLSVEHQLAPVQPVGDGATGKGKKKRGRLGEKPVQPQKERRVCHQQYHPAERQVLHPSPDVREEIPAPEQRKIPRAK